MDIQQAVSLGSPNPVSFYAIGPNDQGFRQFSDEFVQLAIYVGLTDKPPSTISTSYSQEEVGSSPQYLGRMCNEFAKGGSRGVSALFSSGDYGVGRRSGYPCTDFTAEFPSSCPYVTSVGATSISSEGDETVAVWMPPPRSPSGRFSSGGGFCNKFPTPDYQRNDTAAFIEYL